MEAPLTLFIAMSLDGFIAAQNDNLDFLTAVETPGEDYGYSAFTATVDTVIMGRKTYDKVLSFGVDFPHEGKKCYVFSTERTGTDENVEFYNGSPEKLIQKIRDEGSVGIYCDGGAKLVQQLSKLNLFDHYIISIIPVILGSGVRLFGDDGREIKLRLNQTKSFSSGLVQLHYSKQNAML